MLDTSDLTTVDSDASLLLEMAIREPYVWAVHVAYPQRSYR